MEKQATIEASKEALRLGALAFLAAVVTALLEYFTSIQTDATWVAVVTLVLRAADRYLHKSELKTNGLLPF